MAVHWMVTMEILMTISSDKHIQELITARMDYWKKYREERPHDANPNIPRAYQAGYEEAFAKTEKIIEILEQITDPYYVSITDHMRLVAIRKLVEEFNE